MKSNGIAHAHTKANKQSKEEAKKKRKFYFVIGNCILYCIELMIVEFYFSFFFHCNLTIDWYELLITFMSIFQLQRQWFKKKVHFLWLRWKKAKKNNNKKNDPFCMYHRKQLSASYCQPPIVMPFLFRLSTQKFYNTCTHNHLYTTQLRLTVSLFFCFSF